MVSVTDLFAPTIFGLKPGATEREMDWWDQRGGSQVGDVTLLLHWPWSLDPALQFASQNEGLLVCSVCSVSFCIHFWPFHLGIDSWPFAMVQTHFVPRKLGEHITQDGQPFGLLKGTCTPYMVYNSWICTQFR